MTKSKRDKNQFKKISMAELCKASGLSRATIYHYLSIGLLHPGKKIGFKNTFYDDTHLEELNRIRFLRKQKGLSLSEIRGELQGLVRAANSAPHESRLKKKMIMDKAIEIFSKKGYSGTSIGEITDALDISKGTFYLHFKSKRDFFLECISRLAVVMVPKERWSEIRVKTDPIERTRKRIEVFLDAFDNWIGILDLVRYAIRSEDWSLAQKGKEALRIIAGPGLKDYRWALKHGVVCEVNEEIYGYLYVSMAEALGYAAIINPTYTTEELIDVLIKIIYNGILPRNGARRKDYEHLHCGEVTDNKGVKTCVKGIRFNEKDYLSVSHGRANIKVNLQEIEAIKVEEKTPLTVTLTLRGNNKIEMGVPEETTLSSQCIYGEFSISLEEVTFITFFENENAFKRTCSDF